MKRNNKGWHNQPGRHALASKGIQTTVDIQLEKEKNNDEKQMLEKLIQENKSQFVDVIKKSIKDGRERGFMIYQDNGSVETTQTFEGGAQNVDMDDWEDVWDEKGYVNVIGTFHTHFETYTPSYTDVIGLADIYHGVGDYLFITNISDIKDGKGSVVVWKVTDDDNIRESYTSFYTSLLNMMNEYNVPNVHRLWQKVYDTEEEERFNYYEDELRGFIDREEIIEEIGEYRIEWDE